MNNTNINTTVRNPPAKLNGLKNGKSYYFKVMAINEIGMSAPAMSMYPVTIGTIPDPPTYNEQSVIRMPQGNILIIYFRSPHNNGGFPVFLYNIYLFPKLTMIGRVFSDRINVNYTVFNLTNGKYYQFIATATNIIGESNLNLSVPTQPLCPASSVYNFFFDFLFVLCTTVHFQCSLLFFLFLQSVP